MPKVLFVFTSANKTLLGKPTGWFLPEAAHPYWVLVGKADVDFASPAGANPPLDPKSVEMFKEDDESVKFLHDATVQHKLATCKKLSDVAEKDYDAIFYVGGHGPAIDLWQDPVSIKLATAFWQAGKPTAALCHGPAALVNVTDKAGKPIFAGRKAVCFSNAEEESMKMVDDISFLVETRIKQLGGLYEKAPEAWGAKVVVDGRLITGQNPASAKGIGEEILAQISV